MSGAASGCARRVASATAGSGEDRMEFRKLRRRALTALCASAAFTPAAAWAQSDSDGAVSPDDGPIIVTAQKREQRLPDVPVPVTALGSAQLEAAGLERGTEIARPPTNPLHTA